jgi:hypothetical protein
VRRLQATTALAAVLCVTGITAARLHAHDSSKPLALALRAQGATPRGVVFLENYYFDLPFYAGLRQPVPVVESWQAPDIDRRDNWRKELRDAGRFAGESQARRWLVPPEELPRLLCERPVSWVVADRGALQGHPFLHAAQLVAQTPNAGLWRVRCADLKPRETPNATPRTSPTPP